MYSYRFGHASGLLAVEETHSSNTFKSRILDLVWIWIALKELNLPSVIETFQTQIKDTGKGLHQDNDISSVISPVHEGEIDTTKNTLVAIVGFI